MDLSMNQIGFLPATEWAEKIRTKQIPRSRRCERLLERIQRWNQKSTPSPIWRPIRRWMPPAAAETGADGRRTDRPLHGVPVTIKDLAGPRTCRRKGSLTSKVSSRRGHADRAAAEGRRARSSSARPPRRNSAGRACQPQPADRHHA